MRVEAAFLFLSTVILTSAGPAQASLYEDVNQILGQTPSGNQWLIINGGSRILPASFTGWYDKFGNHDASNNNYAAGSIGSHNFFHDFFVFDLSALSGPVYSAVLSVGQGPAVFTNGYFSGGYTSDDQTALTFVTHDVTTPTDRLVASYLERNGSFAPDIYADLGSGAYYGAVQTSMAFDGKQVDVTLNRNALADIRAAEGRTFAIGGTVALTTDPLPADPLPAAPLPAAPLPASLPMFGGALLVLACGVRLRWRKGQVRA